MGLDRLWAGWRRMYIEAIQDPAAAGLAAPGSAESAPVGGARRLDAAVPTGAGPVSLFEGILRLGDDEGYIVHRGTQCSVLLNAYPYTSGHLLVVPNRAAAALGDLDSDEHRELWEQVRDAVVAVERAYRCDGVNVGMNLGSAAGAGVPDHLHAHVVPRWNGDTNFMTAVAETRVLPETLSATWQKVRAAWPGA
jgi:ATP adenylyltransferase